MIKTHFSRLRFIGLLAASLFSIGLLVHPGVTHAATEINDLLNGSTALTRGWEFFRSLMNYAIVGGLLVVAFSNVLRISIDTYAVKKILPALLVSFILANFSLLGSHVLFDVSSSLSRTAQQMALGLNLASGEASQNATAYGPIGSLWAVVHRYLDIKTVLSSGAATAAGAGGIIAALGFGGSVFWPIFFTLIVGVPLLLFLGLWLLFSVRYYVLQLAIVLAPVFIMGMAFPFSRSYFQKWLNVLIVWVFMRPISNFVVAIGVAAIGFGSFNGLFGGFVTFAIVIGALVGAILVPFQLASAATGILKALTNFASGTGRLALAGGLGSLAGTKFGALAGGKVGNVLKGAQGLTRLPENLALLRKRKEGQVIAETDMEAGKILKQHDIADHAARSLAANKAKETAGKEASEKLRHQLEAIKRGDFFDSVGVMDNVFSEGDRSNYYAAINSRLKALVSGGKGKQALDEAKMLLGRNKGGALEGEMLDAIFRTQKDADGKITGVLGMRDDNATAKELLAHASAGALFEQGVVKDSEGHDATVWKHAHHDQQSELVAAKGKEWNKHNKSRQFWDQSGTIGNDVVHGGTYLLSERDMSMNAAHSIGDADPQAVTKGQNASSLVRVEIDATGKEKYVMDDSMIQSIAMGKYSAGQLQELARMSPEGKKALARILSENGEGMKGISDRVEAEVLRIIAAEKLDPKGATAKDLRRSAYSTVVSLQQFSAKGGTKEAAMKPLEVLKDEGLNPENVDVIVQRMASGAKTSGRPQGKKRWERPSKQRKAG